MTIDGPTTQPPPWAEALLRLMLRPQDRDSVSGDLLEEYRERVYPDRGRWRADTWYVTQAIEVVWRVTWARGVLLAASLLGRNALDWWLSPTDDYYARSVVSTAVAVAIFSAVGFWTAWRSRSVSASAWAGVVTGLAAAVIINVASIVAAPSAP